MIAIECIFNKATTTVDGGWNLTFSLPETMGAEVAEASTLRGESLYVVVMTEAEFLATNKTVLK